MPHRGEVSCPHDICLCVAFWGALGLVDISVKICDEVRNSVSSILRCTVPCVYHCRLYNHVDLVQLLDIVSLDEGSEVAGGRGYFLKNEGVLLNQVRILEGK